MIIEPLLIQLMRLIHLRPGESPRGLGITREEYKALLQLNAITASVPGYYGTHLELSSEGLRILEEHNARTFGNPQWDDDLFIEVIQRPSLHSDNGA